MLDYRLCPQAILAKQSGSVYATAAGRLPFNPLVLTEGLRFVRECLAASAGVTSEQRVMRTSLPVLAGYLRKVSGSSE